MADVADGVARIDRTGDRYYLSELLAMGARAESDRAELAFDHGVTAIVGPNCCGKSNVADAITWVLGEQSAKSLRGDRMEDVRTFDAEDARLFLTLANHAAIALEKNKLFERVRVEARRREHHRCLVRHRRGDGRSQ